MRDECERLPMSNPLIRYLRARQTCDSPGLLKEASWTKLSTKLLDLLGRIRKLYKWDRVENRDRPLMKYVVISQFTSMLDLVAQCLKDEAVPFCRIDGKTPPDKRAQEVAIFNKDESVLVFLLSLKAGGTGINLQRARVCFLLDSWWNPAVERQATDRIYRLGSPHESILIYKYFTNDTLDTRMDQIKEEKNELYAKTIGAVENLYW